MIRRFNYTERKRIQRSRVRIVLHDAAAGGGSHKAGQRSFDVTIHLDDMALPPNASVYVEAYHHSLYRRYHLGTIADIHPRDELVVPPAFHRTPLFRVKVVCEEDGLGRILAIADKLRPSTSTDADEQRITLLHVEYADLGDRVWSLELSEEDWPRLVLHRDVPGLREAARSAPAFVGLVYPEVCRRVFEFILRRDASNADLEDDEDWAGLWLRFARTTLGVDTPAPSPDDEDAISTWVETVAACFAARVAARDLCTLWLSQTDV